MRPVVKLLVVVLASVILAPAAAYAQASITGLIRDASGAVLPGVTVEAASPALIEKVRTAVTDGTGRYRIENLRPGEYEITFTLPGFATVKREGIELSGTFVATVNADLRVGAVEETITVTGESPIVDVQSTARQRVLDQEVLEIIPAGRVVASLAGVTPGITSNRDVGGNLGEGQSAGGLRVRGVRDTRVLVGGVPLSTSYRIAQGATNVSAYQEITIDTGGVDAEHAWGGAHVNVIPREGGNSFSGLVVGAFANEAMSGSNFTQELKDRGLSTPNPLKQLLDINPTFGGPILRDKLWFNTSARYSRAWNYAPVFFNKNAGNPNVWTYEPDLSRREAANENTLRAFTHRVTWQATAIHKIAGTYESTHACDCPRLLTASLSPEANLGNYAIGTPYRQASVQWTAPVSSRLLLEANYLQLTRTVARALVNPYFAPSPVPMIQVQEQTTGLRYRGTPNARISKNDVYSGRAVASYVTGAHAFKAGFVYGRTPVDDYTFTLDSAIEYRVRNGVPNRLTLHATPFERRTDLDADHGLFVQDRWTVNRVTVSGGLRYSFLRIKFPEVVVGPSEWTPNRNIVTPETNGATWHNLSPRTSLAIDLFGNGKTALKASLNHYLSAQDRSTLFGEAASPVGALVVRTNRSWADADRDFVPDCDLVNPAANGECGAMDNRNFGSAIPGRAYDPDMNRGFGKRFENWQFSTGVQQEILPRVSVDAAYWRTGFGKFAAIENRAVSASDYDEYSITAPRDPRLPGGGGYVLSGLFDIKPAKFGVPADEFVTSSSRFGKETEVYTGFDFTINARPRPGMLLMGGTSTERQSTNNCDLVASLPRTALEGSEIVVRGTVAETLGASIPRQFCHVKGSFLTQLKLLGSFVIPRIDVQVSASVQNLPGPEIQALYTVSNAEVSRSLGRSLSGGVPNAIVQLIEPGSMYGERMNQVDLRIGKILRFGGRRRATTSLDIYNALNSSSVLDLRNTYDDWQRPTEILTARFAKLVLQLDF
jgi:hypothetical protein